MRIQKKAPNSAVAAAAELKQGHIVIIPTDTIYGFSGLIGKTAEAIARTGGYLPLYRYKNSGTYFKLVACAAHAYRTVKGTGDTGVQMSRG